MEKAKVIFLVALLVFAFGFSKVIEARDTIKDASVQCERPVDCLSLCGECTANMCKTGRCVCGCANKKSMAEAITGMKKFSSWSWS
nr:uncharacterized protein LOC114820210 isoform X2 [Malus domestica]